MTTNYHTPVPTNAPLTNAMLEDRYSDLDAAITEITSGGGAITALNLGAATTLTISSGSITRTQARHLVDTEGSASTDDLTTIAGGANGDRLVISAANTARTVIVKHGTGNIKTFSKTHITLDDADLTVEFQYDGSAWQQVGGFATAPLTYPPANPHRVPANLPLLANPAARNGWGYRASAATVLPFGGVAAPTTTGSTIAAANTADSTYVTMTSGASTGNVAPLVSPSYNLVRRAHNPKLSMVIQITSTAALRYYFGFCSAGITTVDTIAGATEAAVFRYSTVAGDAGWTPITKDATTQTTGSSMESITPATRTLLEIELTASEAIFTINNGTPVAIASNLPALAVELGINLLVFTTENVAKVWSFSRLWVAYD